MLIQSLTLTCGVDVEVDLDVGMRQDRQNPQWELSYQQDVPTCCEASRMIDSSVLRRLRLERKDQ